MKQKYQIDTVFKGFPGKADSWGFGWGAVYLIRTENETILADTGGPAVTPYMEKALQNLGVNLSDIGRVFLTHLHWDHAYNLEFFPNAEFLFGDVEWEFAKRRGDHAVYAPCVDYLKNKKIRMIHEDNEEIAPGMRAVFLPGHTPGCIALILDNGGETWAITGDAVKNRLELHACVAGGNIADTVSAKSIQKIKAIADRFAPGHDCLLRLEKGRVVALGGNDVTVMMPKGLLVNGQENLVLTIDSAF